jgi:hypothetical protein
MDAAISRDFTPTKEQISLHGLGFIQVKLPNKNRLHVWHPDLPRRRCFEYSAIHNHRFGFVSRVLIGTQVNQRYTASENDNGAYDLISHDGPRSPKGGRQSYVSGRADFIAFGDEERINAGQIYIMPALAFHATPNSGVVVTLMEKLIEGTIHAHSAIRHGYVFDQDFDRFQLSEDRLWSFVIDALKTGGL